MNQNSFNTQGNNGIPNNQQLTTEFQTEYSSNTNNNSNKNNKGILIVIIAVIIFAIIGVMLFFVLKPNNNKNTNKENNNQTQSSEGIRLGETDSDKVVTKEFYGYKYSFPSQVSQSGSSDGSVFKSNGCSVFAYKFNDIDFSSWDENTVIESNEHSMFGAISSAFRFYPEEQTITTSKKITNKNNIDMLKVEGTFALSDSKKDFIIYYFSTKENKLRFIIGIVDENRNELIKTIDYVADNLEIAG